MFNLLEYLKNNCPEGTIIREEEVKEIENYLELMGYEVCPEILDKPRKRVCEFKNDTDIRIFVVVEENEDLCMFERYREVLKEDDELRKKYHPFAEISKTNLTTKERYEYIMEENINPSLVVATEEYSMIKYYGYEQLKRIEHDFGKGFTNRTFSSNMIDDTIFADAEKRIYAEDSIFRILEVKAYADKIRNQIIEKKNGKKKQC